MKATKEQIQSWKKQYGDIYEITVEDKVCWLKTPDRNTLSYAMSIGQNKPLEMAEAVLINCWIDGDAEIKTNDQYFFAVAAQIDKVIEIKTASLKKL